MKTKTTDSSFDIFLEVLDEGTAIERKKAQEEYNNAK